MRRLPAPLLLLLLVSPSASADPAPEMMEARELVGRWLDAQNARDLDAYLALYAANFEGVKRTLGGHESKLDLQAWKADRAKMFASKGLSVQIFAEQYSPEGDSIATVFRQQFQSGSYSDEGLKTLVLAKASGQLRIKKEELLSARKLDPGVMIFGGESNDATAAFPAAFTSSATLNWFPCSKKMDCKASVTLNGATSKTILFGTWQSDADGEAHGDHRARLRVFDFVPVGVLTGAVELIVDKTYNDKPAEVLARSAAIVGKDHKVLWSGELRADSDHAAPCRVSVLPDQAKGLDLVYSCGSKQQIVPLKR